MFEVVKKGLYMSLGLASLTRDKLQQLAGEVSQEAKLSEDEGRRFGEELQHRAEEARADLSTQIDQQIDHALVQLGIMKSGVKKAADRTRDELQSFVDARVDAALERLKVARQEDIDALLRRVELLEARAPSASPTDSP